MPRSKRSKVTAKTSSKMKFDARVRYYSNISLVASIILLLFGAIVASIL
ncbi:MAG: hypothetical protein ACYCO0_02275 [Candidatus Micrarchaeaceae archaeon]